MFISWYNNMGHERTCSITLIDDIQKYDENEFFCLRIRSDKVLLGGILWKFKSVEKRDRAYSDIKNALDTGEKKFEFQKGYYEYIF